MLREKKRVKVVILESFECEKFTCIGVDVKTNNITDVFKDMTGEFGERNEKTVYESEHHLTFTQESENNKGQHLTHSVVSQNATPQALSNEIVKVLKEFERLSSVKADFLDNKSVDTGFRIE